MYLFLLIDRRNLANVRVLLSVLVASTLCVALGGCASLSLRPRLPIGKIVLSRTGAHGGHASDMVELDSAGSEKIVARLAGGVTSPLWSPDGKRIAFEQDLNGVCALGVMDADGRKRQLVTSDHDRVRSPSWSPDGKKIAYYCWDEGSYCSIHVVDADGKNDLRIGLSDRTQSYPQWSPDGQRILFHMNDGNDEWNVAVMNVDGSDLKRLTEATKSNWLPIYSPDGSKIAFWSDRTGQWELYFMNSDGSNLKVLPGNGLGLGLFGVPRAVFSPDGKYLAYPSINLLGKFSLRVVDLDGNQINFAGEIDDLGQWLPADFPTQPGAKIIPTIMPVR